MAHGFHRGQAAQYNIFMRNLSDYLGGLGESGQFQDLIKSLYEAQEPTMMGAMEKYGHQAAGFGQAVPGQGFSGAAQEGERDLMADFMANITGQALGAYQMPYSGLFQATPQISGQYMGTKSAPTASEQLQQPMAGMSCCFIFVEADNGILNRIARRFRDEKGTLKQQAGYTWIANHLVPWMRKSKRIKNFVRWAMIKPLIWSGKAFYGENNWGFVFWPIGIMWLVIFDFIGGMRPNELPQRTLLSPAV